jgi:hypothetical protein
MGCYIEASFNLEHLDILAFYFIKESLRERLYVPMRRWPARVMSILFIKHIVLVL